ncbi:MAG: endolytic transglycosylase MltG, partial [Actinomycetota bacterium]
PYNTYQESGLPPTPIASPGLASLEAAAEPASTDFLYYVLSSRDGSHTFSTNLEDHNAAVRQAREDGVLP